MRIGSSAPQRSLMTCIAHLSAAAADVRHCDAGSISGLHTRSQCESGAGCVVRAREQRTARNTGWNTRNLRRVNGVLVHTVAATVGLAALLAAALCIERGPARGRGVPSVARDFGVALSEQRYRDDARGRRLGNPATRFRDQRAQSESRPLLPCILASICRFQTRGRSSAGRGARCPVHHERDPRELAVRAGRRVA